ncbi:MAG: hypothetical protein ACTSUE_18740 [Promethearchaeota archaeon]
MKWLEIAVEAMKKYRSPYLSSWDLSGLRLRDLPLKVLTNTNSGTTFLTFPEQIRILFQEECNSIKKSIDKQKKTLEQYESDWDGNGAESFAHSLLEKIPGIINEFYDRLLITSPLLVH